MKIACTCEGSESGRELCGEAFLKGRKRGDKVITESET